MKRLLSAALALSLLGTTAAQAGPFDYRQHERHDNSRGWGYDRSDYRGHDRNWRHHNNDAGAVLAVGVGLIALTAILASNHDRERERDYDRYDSPPPPPPEYGPGPEEPYSPRPYDR